MPVDKKVEVAKFAKKVAAAKPKAKTALSFVPSRTTKVNPGGLLATFAKKK